MKIITMFTPSGQFSHYLLVTLGGFFEEVTTGVNHATFEAAQDEMIALGGGLI